MFIFTKNMLFVMTCFNPSPSVLVTIYYVIIVNIMYAS